ncbi:MAG: hypothetical protein JXR03_18215 [Cyclobacteriaceae bacterium]
MKKYLSASLFLLSSYLILHAQSTNPLNSNYLIEQGVSPLVLDAAASQLLQEGSFVQDIVIEITASGVTNTYEISVIYDPAYKDGKDLRFVVEESAFSKKELKELKASIEESHQYSRLSRNYLYNESTLKIVEESSEQVVLEYYYQKDDLEPGLTTIKRLKGNVYFNDGELDKVVLTNFKPLRGNKTNFERTVNFERTKDHGGHIVSSVVEKFTENKGKVSRDIVMCFNTLDYRSVEGESVSWESKGTVEPQFDQNSAIDTVAVTLGGVLPFMGKPATKLGFGLPRPWGVNIIRHQQNTDLQFTDLQIGLNDGELSSLAGLFALDQSSLEESVSSWMVRADVWLFPFLNVYGLVGRAEASIKGDLVLDEELRSTIIGLAPFLGLNPADIPTAIPLDLNVDVNTVGGGATLAGGVGDFMATVNYQFVVAFVPEANTSTPSHILMPLVGYRLPFGVALMAGAMGQFYDSSIVGFIDMRNGDKLNYNVGFEPRQWNGILGAYVGFGKHWDLAINAGFGDRKSTTAVLGYRF